MLTEALDAEKEAKKQAKAISNLSGLEIPQPGDWLFETIERNRTEKLFAPDKLEICYLPRKQLAATASFPGFNVRPRELFYEHIKEGYIDREAEWLRESWMLLDTTERPLKWNFGEQMYDDTPRFRELIAALREQDQLVAYKVARPHGKVPKDSRFDISANEIDGDSAVIARAVANILGLQPEQVSTPPYATFVYIGNLFHPELGQANSQEWFKDGWKQDGRIVHRLYGGNADQGGLSDVDFQRAGVSWNWVGFRLQISASAKNKLSQNSQQPRRKFKFW